MDLFESKNIAPMLIGADGEAFDSPEYLYELKLDGERCVAYLDPEVGTTELRNKRNIRMLPKVPELAELHLQVRRRCILDGELAILVGGKPDFSEIQRRSLMSNPLKIELASRQHPACFTAFDILYLDNQSVTDQTLTERKQLLHDVVQAEGPRFAVSRCIEQNGTAFYQLAEEHDLEGIVAKRKESRYYLGKRTKDWIKCKNLKDEDYVVCGYIPKESSMTSLVLGQYRGAELLYQGHVTLGVGGENFRKIQSLPRLDEPPLAVPSGHGNENAVWVEPELACTVKYMEKTANGGLRQPVFKGLREDKKPENCVVPSDLCK